MKSNPIIDKNLLRSDQDPSQAPAAQEQPSQRQAEAQKQAEEESLAADYGRSSSFVAIDLYGQERSEYLYTSLFTGVIQVPILITIHELLVIRKQVNPYEIAYGVIFV